MFTRRNFLFLAVAGSVSGLVNAAAADKRSAEAVTFVRQLYVREITRHVAAIWGGEEDFLSVFTTEVRDLWRKGRNSGARVPAGPILNAFFG